MALSNHILGIFQPYAAWHKTKYNPEGTSNFANQLIASSLIPYDDNLAAEAKKCIMASLSRKTWAKYNSAWNAFKKFEKSLGAPFTWPLPETAYRGFATWCIRTRKLTAATTKAYITALTTAHTLAGLEDCAVRPGRLTHHILAGGKNLEILYSNKSSTRRSINLTVLKILGHQLAVSSWSPGSKQVVWTAIVTGFFASARMGELLPPDDFSYDPNSTLLWEQVDFRRDGGILLHARLPKVSKKEGEFLDLFPFHDKTCCPVMALKRLLLMQNKQGSLKLNLPVFRFPSGRNLTQKCLNAVLKTMLGDIYKQGIDSITCHSLRSAIPTALHEAPSTATASDIKEWGRWSSTASEAYTKLHRKHKRAVFDKVTSALTM
jgi:hypothetical protein